jgi:hypothetical protein
MKINKITATFFLLTAAFILLAHAVIPHHHHQLQVCVEKAHCQEDGNSHQPETTKQNHQHDDNSDSTNCILKQAVVLPSNQDKQVYDCDFNKDNYSYDYLSTFLYAFVYTGTEAPIPDFCIVDLIPDILSSYSCYVNTSLGLRAPPAV